MDVWALPLSGVAPQGGSPHPHPVVNSEFEEEQPQVSPDGRWLAYMSDVTGRFEIYVRPLTADARAGEATRVSSSGAFSRAGVTMERAVLRQRVARDIGGGNDDRAGAGRR
jgi:hypothetical protein